MKSFNSIGCRDFLQMRMSRRRLLQIGGLGLGGLTLAQLLRAEAQAKHSSPKGPGAPATARSVILLFQFGGPSHIDTFDPKPQAPREIRGEFATVITENIVHGSDSPESAEREIAIFFPAEAGQSST